MRSFTTPVRDAAVAVAALALTAHAYAGITPGEDCANAAVVDSFFIGHGYDASVFAGGAPAASCDQAGTISLANDGWWVYTSDRFGTAQFSATTATQGLVLVAYTGTCGDLTEIACEAAPGTTLVSRAGTFASINWDVTPGTAYYFRSGFPGTPPLRGPGDTVNVTFTVNDDPPGDDCASAVDIPSVPFVASYNADPLADGPPAPCDLDATLTKKDGWYSFTPTENGLANFEASSDQSIGLVAAVYEGSCKELVPVDCEVFEPVARGGIVLNLYWSAAAGTTYYIQVGEPDPTPPRGGPTINVGLDLTPFVDGDDCIVAIPIEENPFGSSYNPMDYLPGQGGSCLSGPNIDYDIWYEVVPGFTGTAQFVIGSDIDTPAWAITVYTGDCGDLTEIACVANEVFASGGGTILQIQWPAAKGTRYLIQAGVQDVMRGIGPFNTSFILLGPDAADFCEDAAVIDGVPFIAEHQLFLATAGTPPGSCNDASATEMQADGWYQWTAPADGTATFSASNSSVLDGAIVAVYDGSCATLNELTCDSQIGAVSLTRGMGVTASAEFSITGGTTYYLQAGVPTQPAARGVPPLEIMLTAVFTAGNTCFTANCILEVPFSTTYDPSGLSDGLARNECTENDRIGVFMTGWYKWTAPAAGIATLDSAIVGVNSGEILTTVYTGEDCLITLEPAYCELTIQLESRDVQNGTIQWETVEGDTYWIQIGFPDLADLPPARGAAPEIFVELSLDPFLIPCPQSTFQKLMADDAGINDFFGFSVDVQESLAVVGAVEEDENGKSSGAVYVYEFDEMTEEWVQISKILSSDGVTQDRFGARVALNGPYLAASAPSKAGATTGEGAVYIFERDAGDPTMWNEIKKVISPMPQQQETFGAALDFIGETLAVGNRIGDGAVYVFEQNEGGPNNFGVVQTVLSDARSRFGWDLELSGNLMIVGAPGDNGAEPGQGSAYVYRFEEVPPRGPVIEEYVLVQKIVNPDPEPLSRFGDSVAIDAFSGYAVVGASEDRRFGFQAGRAFVFERDLGGIDNWGLADILAPADLMPLDEFGRDVAIAGATAFVGCPLADLIEPGVPSRTDVPPPIITPDVGAVYVYARDTGGPGTWDQLIKIHALDADTGDLFGFSINLDLVGQLIIGAPTDDEAIGNAGAAYVGPGGYSDCNLNGFLDICDILEGESSDIDENFTPDECEFFVCLVPPYQDLLPHDYLGEFRGPGFPDPNQDHGYSVAIDSPLSIVGAPRRDFDDIVCCGDETSALYPNAGAVDAYFLFSNLVGPPMPPRGGDLAFEWREDFTLHSPYPETDARFGWSVDLEILSLSSARIMVGAPGQDHAHHEECESRYTSEKGVAYIFELFGGPALEAGAYFPHVELQGDDVLDFDQFGWDVKLNGDYAIAGAPFHNISLDPVTGPPTLIQSAGAAYIFKRSDDFAPGPWTGLFFDWYQVAKLVADVPEEFDILGFSVDLEDDRAAVGAPGQALIRVADPDPSPGSVYIFEPVAMPPALRGLPMEDWQQVAKLTADDGESFDGLGWDVALEGNIVAAGAPFHSSGEPMPRGIDAEGAVYIFAITEERGNGGWTQVAKLTAPDGEIDDRFGWSLAIYDDFLIVGAPGDTLSEFDMIDPTRWEGTWTGSVYVYQRGESASEWNLMGKLIAPDFATFFFPYTQEGALSLGHSVDLDNFNAIAGAPDTEFTGFVGESRGGGTQPPGEFPGAAFVFAPIDDCQPNGILDFCDLPYADEFYGPPFFGGDSLDDNYNLFPDECEMPGACCFIDFFGGTPGLGDPNGTPIGCIETTEFECGILRGLFEGEGTTCAQADCDAIGACCIEQVIRGSQIGFVDFDGSEQGLIGYTNPTYTFSGTGLGTDAAEVSANGSSTWGDNACWPMIRSALGPNGLQMPHGIADESVSAVTGGAINTGDLIGLAKQTKTDGFFGANDTSDETGAQDLTVEFVFDIRNYVDLGVSIDFAAMGNFETETVAPRDGNPFDTFRFEYSIDGQVFQTLFAPDADENAVGTYEMDNPANNPVMLDDPLKLEGGQLNQVFINYDSSVTGFGDELTVRFIVNCDGSAEGFAFDNLTIFGIPAPVICMEVPEVECLIYGGTYDGDGTSCDGNPCLVFGACCLTGLPDRLVACIDTTEEECVLGFMGVFQGNMTDCATTECVTTGACCPINGGIDRAVICVDTTAIECAETIMGVFAGEGTDCATTDCTSIGACCWSCPVPNGTPVTEAAECIDALTLDQCCLIDGLWAGPQTACSMMPCTTLPICEADLDGNNTTDVFDFGIFALNFGCGTMTPPREDCIADLNCDGQVDVFDFGDFALNFGCIGPALPFTQCGSPNKPLTGACCVIFNSGPGASCIGDLTEDDCVSQGGSYQGDGVICSTGTCESGACCIGTSAPTCSDLTAAECANVGGSFLGSGTNCISDTCDIP